MKRFLRRQLHGSPWLYTRWRGLKRPDAAVRRDTELVIEGFPRSGNTFCELAFRASQQRPLVIAHHSHAPAQVLAGVRQGLPVLVVLRDIKQSMESFAAHSGGRKGMDRAIDDYLWYHQTIAADAGKYATVEFNELTSDFPAVIAAFANRFRMNLSVPDDMAKVKQRTFELMDERGRTLFGRTEGGANPERDKSAELAFRKQARDVMDSDPKLRQKIEASRELMRSIHAKSALLPNHAKDALEKG